METISTKAREIPVLASACFKKSRIEYLEERFKEIFWQYLLFQVTTFCKKKSEFWEFLGPITPLYAKRDENLERILESYIDIQKITFRELPRVTFRKFRLHYYTEFRIAIRYLHTFLSF